MDAGPNPALNGERVAGSAWPPGEGPDANRRRLKETEELEAAVGIEPSARSRKPLKSKGRARFRCALGVATTALALTAAGCDSADHLAPAREELLPFCKEECGGPARVVFYMNGQWDCGCLMNSRIVPTPAEPES